MLFKKVSIGIIILLVIIFGWKYWDLTRTINKLDAQLEELKNKKVVLETDLQTEKTNNKILAETISSLNSDIAKMEIRNQKTIRAYNDYVKKSKNEKYKESVVNIVNKDYSNATCEEGIRLNKKISEMKYEDL